MIKILNNNNRNFERQLNQLLSIRKNKVQSSTISVSNIIKDVKKNGDKALLKYEKKFNKNLIIVPTSQQINKSIKRLDKKVKQAINTAYNRIYKFTHYKNLKIFHTLINLKINLSINIYQSTLLQYMFQAQLFHTPQLF